VLMTIDKYILGGALSLGLLVGVWFHGRADGVSDTNESWRNKQAAYEQQAKETARKEFESRERLHDKVTEKTNTIVRESKVYYETAPNPVCIDADRASVLAKARGEIASTAGSDTGSEADALARRPETSPSGE
jgi:hypothetical protein